MSKQSTVRLTRFKIIDVPCFIFGIVIHHVDFLYGMQVSHAGRPWICGRALMERSLSPEDNLTDNDEDMAAWKKNFDWENQYRELLAQSTRPAAKIALLLSAATRDLYKGEINDVTEETFQMGNGGFTVGAEPVKIILYGHY